MILCDFCGSPLEATRAHEVVCKPVVTVLMASGRLMVCASPDNWAACDVCYSRLKIGAYDEIIRDGELLSGLACPADLKKHLIETYKQMEVR